MANFKSTVIRGDLIVKRNTNTLSLNNVELDYNRASSVLSGATVFSNLVVENGIVTGISTRNLTLADLGYTGDSDSNYYVHPNKTWVNKTSLSGATVISNLTIDALGHPTNWTTRNLTASDVGALSISNNLSDLNNTSTARTNLGLTGDSNTTHYHDTRYYENNYGGIYTLKSSSDVGYTVGSSSGRFAHLRGGLGIANVTYIQALADAASKGVRLPTVDEIEDGIVTGTGGGFDSEICWTSTTVPGRPGYVYAKLGTGAGTRYEYATDGTQTAYTRYVANIDVPFSSANWDSAYTHISSTGADHSYINQSVTTAASPTFNGATFNSPITSFGTSSRDHIRVWTTSSYTIGMKSGFTFGAINNDYAMTFQMNNVNNRGFWWGDEGHTDAQGAMSLSTDGKLSIAHSIRIGYGESDTTIPGATYKLDVSGNARFTGTVTGSNLAITNWNSAYTDTSTATDANTVNKIMKRNSSGDVHARLFRSEYMNQSTIGGAIAYRTSTTDNYIRFCNDMPAIRSFIGAQATLVSGTNIKTVNSQSLLGSGNISIEAGDVNYTNFEIVYNASSNSLDFNYIG